MNIEDFNNDKNNPRTSVNLEIPYRLATMGTNDPNEIFESILEQVRLESSTIFDMIRYFSEEIRRKPKTASTLIEFILTLAPLGSGFQECLDQAEMYLRREKRKIEKPSEMPANSEASEKPVSMSDFDAVEHLDIMSLGGVLTLVLDNPKLPDGVRNAIKESLNDIYNNLPKDEDVEEIDGFKDFSMTYNQLLFGKYEKILNAQKPDVLDLSSHPESVQRLNKQQTEKLIKKHKLPDEISSILRSCAGEVKQ